MENNNNKNQLPPELDWSNMQSGIRNKMEAIEAQERLGRQRRNGIIIASVTVLVLVLLLLGPCKSLLQNDNGRLSDASTSELPASTPSSTETEDIPDDLSASIDNDFTLSESGSTPITKASIANIKPTSGSRTRAGQVAGFDSSGITVSSQMPEKSDITSDHEALTPPVLESPATDVDNAIDGLNAEANTTGEIRRDAGPFLHLPSETTTSIEPINEMDVPNQIIPSRNSSLAEDRISLTGGIAFWNMGYGSNEPERAEFEEALVSFSGGINYTHVFRSGFFATVGLNMMQLESRFEWSRQLNNYTITLADTIAEVQVNALTGEYTNVIGDVDVSVAAERNVIHYNSTRLFQVPVAIGKTWRWNRWQADLMVGALLNVQTSNTGRTLFDGELIDYDGALTDFMSNQWRVHGLGAVNAIYRITEQIGVTAGLQFQKSISNWSTEEGVEMRPFLFGGQIGLTYMFK